MLGRYPFTKLQPQPCPGNLLNSSLRLRVFLQLENWVTERIIPEVRSLITDVISVSTIAVTILKGLYD